MAGAPDVIDRYLGRFSGPSSSVATSAPGVVAPRASSPGSISVGANTPDYAKLILSDPAYLAYQANAGKSVNDAAAARTAALKALAVQFGGLPTGFNDQYGDIDAATVDQSKANPYSDEASLQRNYQQGIEAFKRQLAGRGALQSGDLQYGLDNADYAKGQQDFDLQQQFGAAARTAIGNFTGAVDTANQNQVSAISQAEQNVYNNPANRPSIGETAMYNAALSAQFGSPIYTTSTGSHYTLDAQGNPVAWNGGGVSASPSSAPSPGTVIPASGSGSYFTGGVPGGTVSGDPEHNAFISGQSDVDPFAVGQPNSQAFFGYQVNPDGSVAPRGAGTTFKAS